MLSRSPRYIPWQLVCSGLLAQFFLGYVILKTTLGYNIFKSFGGGVSAFLGYSDAGAGFVFGSSLMTVFAFKVLPTIVFFSSFVSVAYYLGVLQVLIRAIASVLRCLMGTSMVESVNTAANIFLGQTESPLLIRPFSPRQPPPRSIAS